MYDNKILSRSFFEDFGTHQFKIIGKTFFYDVEAYDELGNYIEMEMPHEPHVNYDIELVFNDY
ncbi:hypothetical protein [Myroides injenensis]|uniref:Uncharacterized protein n=1 Tax=Myroides odoratimimus TaxID=76832 RepID=A0AAI8C857_9FLAO|nr:hypothetical protein [Myroides injenensis]ALU28443.1 hypothetical protein AS202_19880 [Myroides odoratimimus]